MYIEKRSNRVLTQKQHDKIKQPKTVEARLLGLALAERQSVNVQEISTDIRQVYCSYLWVDYTLHVNNGNDSRSTAG